MTDAGADLPTEGRVAGERGARWNQVRRKLPRVSWKLSGYFRRRPARDAVAAIARVRSFVVWT